MAQFRIPVLQFRSLPAPSNPKGKVGVFYAPTMNIPADLRDWRDVNPREVKTTTAVYDAIWQTLTDDPEHFAERNRGLTISAQDVQYDEKRREVLMSLEDKNLHGVVDGGHTLDAIVKAQPAFRDVPWPAEVFVKVVTGVLPDQIAEIAGGLNSSQQVDLKSLENLKAHFTRLQEVLKDEPYSKKIAYKMNEEKPVDVREVLYYLAVFDRNTYSGERHPTALFGRKEGIVRDFAKEAKGGFSGSFGILTSKADQILKLRDMLEKRALAEDVGRHKVGKKGRIRSPENTKNFLQFLNEPVKGKIPLGWLMPMLGGFRANVVWDDPKGTLSWAVPNEELIEMCIEGLVEGVKEIHEEQGSRPEYVGRNATAWRVCYDRVRIAIQDYQLAQARGR